MRPKRALQAGLAALSLLALTAAAAVQGPGLLPLPSTLEDFFGPGTQPGTIASFPIFESATCQSCHAGYDEAQEPMTRWAASMMAQSGRDPIFYACLAIANQDAANSGELCLRCHAPGAWLAGRSTPTDGSALDPLLGDLDGVNCHTCHRMVDPVWEQGVNPDRDKRILDFSIAHPVPTNPHSGQMVIDPEDVRRGPFDLGAGFFYHDWRESPFHQESLLCATCHDVSNPMYVRQPDGTYALDPLDQAHPTHDKYDQFPVERTFSEWSQSTFAEAPLDTGGRFGGNQPEVQSCQDCHMPDTSGIGCAPFLGSPVRDDLPQHDFNGANSWVLDAVRTLYPDNETKLTDASVAAAKLRTQEMMRDSNDLHVFERGGQVVVRVVNMTGHKLPTGYPEGRRMWLNVVFRDGGGAPLAELGHYDPATAVLTQDTTVWEAKLGLDAAAAAATGLPQGESFHFVLNNTIVQDNRIPPRGFRNASFEAVQAGVVGEVYPDEHYWHESTFALPPGTAEVEVALYHQTTTKEYIEFLRDANTTNNAGQVAYDQWVLHGKSAPAEMGRVVLDLAGRGCAPPVAYGTPKRASDGSRVRIGWAGSTSLAANNFHVTLHDGLPGSNGVVFWGPGTQSQPFMGGRLLVAAPQTRKGTFSFDAAGYAQVQVDLAGLSAGDVRGLQAFFRDVQDPVQYGLSDGLYVEFCP